MIKDNKKLGIAIVGTSGMGHAHAKAWLDIPDVKLLGVFSADGGRAREFAGCYQIKSYDNFSELLVEPELDIVDIVNVHSQHAEFGIKAARAGKHIIVEKPLDVSVARAKELINTCRQNKVYLATVFQHRFDQPIKQLKELIERGRLGRVFLVSAALVVRRPQEYYEESGGWRAKKELSGGGVLINQAIHIIDGLTYLFGEASSAYGETEIFTHDIEVEDTAVGVIRFKNNILATLYATTSGFMGLPNRIEVHGTRGSAVIEGESLKLFTAQRGLLKKLWDKSWGRIKNRLPYFFDFRKRLKPGWHKENLENIIKAIKSGQKPPASFEQGLKSLEIVEAIFGAEKSKRFSLIRPAARKNFGGDYYRKYLAEALVNKPKILLINPLIETASNVQFSHIAHVRSRQPLGLANISAFLKKDYSAQLVDAAVLKWESQKTIEFINAVSPEILIISSGPLDRWQNPDLDISEVFKIINGVKVKHKILIGAHGSVTPDWIFKNCDVGFIVKGEPELTCAELVKNILAGNQDFSKIAGLSWRKGNEIVHNQDRIFDSNLDEYPFPDYESLPMHLYTYSVADLSEPFSLMLASRGCPGQCIFCLKAMMPGRWRARSAANVFAEIKYLVDNFAIKSIYFQDWEFVIDRQRVKDLCQMLVDADFEVRWGCSARASSLDQEIIGSMKRAGCVLINFGFESGSEEIIKSAQKGVSLQKVKEVVNWCAQAGINIRAFCLVNLPGETKKTMKETAKFVAGNDLNIPRINVPIPYPGTKLAKLIESDSWEKAPSLAGKVQTKTDPEEARKLLRNYIWQSKFGTFYFLNPKFCAHVFKMFKEKFL